MFPGYKCLLKSWSERGKSQFSCCFKLVRENKLKGFKCDQRRFVVFLDTSNFIGLLEHDVGSWAAAESAQEQAIFLRELKESIVALLGFLEAELKTQRKPERSESRAGKKLRTRSH